MQNGTFLSLVLLLQVLSEMFQGDPGVVGPQVRVKASLSHLHTLVHQVEELVMFWGRRGKLGGKFGMAGFATSKISKEEELEEICLHFSEDCV